MSFAVSAERYDRFMGRFSAPLAPVFADFAAVRGEGALGRSVLDVGCGPGALLEELLARGARPTGIDPSPTFVAAARERNRGVEVVEAAAEELPFGDAAFDAALAQLVVHFMRDPDAGVAEMARVTRPGGTVAACVWDHAAGPLGAFWAGVASLHEGGGAPPSEAARVGSQPGDLARVLSGAGVTGVVEEAIEVRVAFDDFDSWWEPFELGVGPAGDHVAALDERGRRRLRAACRARVPEPPFEARAVAWAARGTRA